MIKRAEGRELHFSGVENTPCLILKWSLPAKETQFCTLAGVVISLLDGTNQFFSRIIESACDNLGLGLNKKYIPFTRLDFFPHYIHHGVVRVGIAPYSLLQTLGTTSGKQSGYEAFKGRV